MKRRELRSAVVLVMAIGALLPSCESDGGSGSLATRGLSVVGDEATEPVAALAAPTPLRVPSRFAPPVPAELAEGAGIIQSYPWA
ncbi:MAG: hypothetical protein RL033_1987, partial [Pseudomonadota bacterium]